MATKPTEKPRWASTAINNGPGGEPNISTPLSGKQDIGWEYLEKPPREWWNWMQNLNYQWINYFEEVTDVNIGVSSDFGQDVPNTVGLNFGVLGGRVRRDDDLINISPVILPFSPSLSAIVYIRLSDNTIQADITPPTTEIIRLFEVTTDATSFTSIIDVRTWANATFPQKLINGTTSIRTTTNGDIDFEVSGLDRLVVGAGSLRIPNSNTYDVGGLGDSLIGSLGSTSNILQLISSSNRDIRIGSDIVNSAIYINGGNGNVSIGGTGLTDKMTVYESKTYSSGVPLTNFGVADTTSMAAGVGGSVVLYGKYNIAGDLTPFASIEASKSTGIDGQLEGDLILKTRNLSGFHLEAMRLTSGQSVLIGAPSPILGAKLTVGGPITVRNGGVDGLYNDGILFNYNANVNEHNAIKTAVSSTASASGFRFDVSNGSGSSDVTAMMRINRDAVRVFGGGLQAPDGSSTGPSVSFINYTGQGMWADASQLSFSMNNVERLRIDGFGVSTRTDGFLSIDGTAANTSYGFNSESGLGLYRALLNTMVLVAGGLDQLIISTGAVTSRLPIRAPSGNSLIPSFTFEQEDTLGMFRGGIGVLAFGSSVGTLLSLSSSGMNIFSNVITAQDGSEGDPAYSFNTVQTKGMFSTAPGLGFSAAGVKRFEIKDVGGNVSYEDITIQRSGTNPSLYITSDDNYQAGIILQNSLVNQWRIYNEGLTTDALKIVNAANTVIVSIPQGGNTIEINSSIDVDDTIRVDSITDLSNGPLILSAFTGVGSNLVNLTLNPSDSSVEVSTFTADLPVTGLSQVMVGARSKPGLSINRVNSDGGLIIFEQDGVLEGSIAVSGTTVSYNSFSGTHWSQLSNSSRDATIEKGTVMSVIDEMCAWPGEENEQLARCKVSDEVGDKCVYGVFQRYDDQDAPNPTNDLYVVSLGAYVIRVTGACQKGDLVESNGDGTARVQEDDVIKSSTIAKLTQSSNEVGVKLVPCVLYCG